MKKLCVVLSVTLGIFLFPAFAEAQTEYDFAIGLRAGNPSGITAKYNIQGPHVLEGILGFNVLNGVAATALYEYHIPIADGAAWYFGGGASTGVSVGDASQFFVSVDGIIGVEYTLSQVPLNFSIDWKPSFGSRGLGFGPSEAGISIRYVLN